MLWFDSKRLLANQDREGIHPIESMYFTFYIRYLVAV